MAMGLILVFDERLRVAVRSHDEQRRPKPGSAGAHRVHFLIFVILLPWMPSAYIAPFWSKMNA
jgi:hypothetical protein